MPLESPVFSTINYAPETLNFPCGVLTPKNRSVTRAIGGVVTRRRRRAFEPTPGPRLVLASVLDAGA